MTLDGYSIPQLAADLKRIRTECDDEHRLLAAVRPLARRAAESSSLWLAERMLQPDPEQGFSLFPLSEEDDHALAVFAFSWLPDRGTPPHDHGTWAVVAGVIGPEWNTFWRRQDDATRPGYAKLTQIGAKTFLPGEVLAMPTRHDPPGVEPDGGRHRFAPYLRHAHQSHGALAVRPGKLHGATLHRPRRGVTGEGAGLGAGEPPAVSLCFPSDRDAAVIVKQIWTANSFRNFNYLIACAETG